MYTVRVEGLSRDVDYLILYLILTCNDENSVAAADCVTHRKFLQATIAFILKVRGVNIITST